MAKVSVIIPAAGRGERFGGRENKIFAKLDGRPVFLRTVELFINREDVIQTLLVVSPEDMNEIKERYAANLGFMGVQVAVGGQRRCDTVRQSLEKIRDDCDLIAVHDAVRPCTSTAMIDSVFTAAAKHGAAILAAPLAGTIKRVSVNQQVESTVPRSNLYEAQTPQVFRRDWLIEAHAYPVPQDEVVTDDAQLVERMGRMVAVVSSDSSNLKITTKGDLPLAGAIIKMRPPPKPTSGLGAFEEAQW